MSIHSKMQTNIEIGSNTHVGRRNDNQDFYTFMECEDGLLLVVCDGMGGVSGGSRASWLCANHIKNYFEDPIHHDIKNMLVESIIQANTLIYNEAQDNPSLSGMGTTCVVAVISDYMIYYANVGDSRIYFIRRSTNEIKQITKDHSRVQELLDEGKITKEEAINHPERNVITQSVGDYLDIIVDVGLLDKKLMQGDAVLLCTDGLTGVLDDETIKNVVIENSPQYACNILTKLAYDLGGSDNITVQIAKYI